MKKVLLLAVAFLGTTMMVNAQEPAKTVPAKEVKTVKKHKKVKKDGDKKMEATSTTTKTAVKK